MTKQAALNKYLSSFGMAAYPENNVPDFDKITFPYMTYENTVGHAGQTVDITVNLWYRTKSEAIPNRKVDEIADSITLGGRVLHYDNGSIWVKMGSPWCNALEDGADATIKRRVLNIQLDFM